MLRLLRCRATLRKQKCYELLKGTESLEEKNRLWQIHETSMFFFSFIGGYYYFCVCHKKGFFLPLFKS